MSVPGLFGDGLADAKGTVPGAVLKEPPELLAGRRAASRRVYAVSDRRHMPRRDRLPARPQSPLSIASQKIGFELLRFVGSHV